MCKGALNIELDHVTVDELHLLLRAMDVMLDNIITEVIDWDKDNDFKKTSSQPKGLHLQKLVREIRSCGVGFDVWEIRNPADNKGTGKYDLKASLEMTRKRFWPWQKSFLQFCMKIPALK